MPLHVAVLGASGFGRHHAKWYADLGCEVVAFLGSSPRRAEATAAILRQAFGFQGRGYTSLPDLLAAERPDAVSVCTPPPLHGEHVRAALEAGCSALCEKPFVWRPGVPSAELVAEARSLVEEAGRRGLILAVNTQYAAAAEEYRRLAPEAVAAPQSFFGEMASKLRPGSTRGIEIALDLMPHPISILLGLFPDAELEPGSVRTTVHYEDTVSEFRVAAAGRTWPVSLRAAQRPEPPFPRRFGFNGQVADVGTRPDAQGVYRGYLALDGRERVCEDFMRVSIERFCRAVRGEGAPLAPGRLAARNLELLLATLERASPSS